MASGGGGHGRGSRGSRDRRAGSDGSRRWRRRGRRRLGLSNENRVTCRLLARARPLRPDRARPPACRSPASPAPLSDVFVGSPSPAGCMARPPLHNAPYNADPPAVKRCQRLPAVEGGGTIEFALVLNGPARSPTRPYRPIWDGLRRVLAVLPGRTWCAPPAELARDRSGGYADRLGSMMAACRCSRSATSSCPASRCRCTCSSRGTASSSSTAWRRRSRVRGRAHRARQRGRRWRRARVDRNGRPHRARDRRSGRALHGGRRRRPPRQRARVARRRPVPRAPRSRIGTGFDRRRSPAAFVDPARRRVGEVLALAGNSVPLCRVATCAPAMCRLWPRTSWACSPPRPGGPLSTSRHLPAAAPFQHPRRGARRRRVDVALPARLTGRTDVETGAVAWIRQRRAHPEPRDVDV